MRSAKVTRMNATIQVDHDVKMQFVEAAPVTITAVKGGDECAIEYAGGLAIRLKTTDMVKALGINDKDLSKEEISLINSIRDAKLATEVCKISQQKQADAETKAADAKRLADNDKLYRDQLIRDLMQRVTGIYEKLAVCIEKPDEPAQGAQTASCRASDNATSVEIAADDDSQKPIESDAHAADPQHNDQNGAKNAATKKKKRGGWPKGKKQKPSGDPVPV